MKTQKFYFIIFFFLLPIVGVWAQPAEKLVKVAVSANRADWLYKTGENIKFDISVTTNNVPIKDVEIRYEISEDMMPPHVRETKVLKNGTTTIDASTMKKAGFLRCTVYAKYNGREYKGMATAGVEPEKIQPTTTLPDDFKAFWDKGKADLAKIPLDSRMTLIPEKCTDKINAYHISVQNINGSRVYGILYIPKAPGKYPAFLKVPGAGIRPYSGDANIASKGVITLEIGIHGIPVNLPAEVYNDLSRGALNGYWNFNLNNKDNYYYKRVYLGCIRAIDFIYSLPEFDGNNLVTYGGSQGGALSIVTSALDSRVKGLLAFFPALCDLTGYLHKRAGGWPHMFNNPAYNTTENIETSRYYDVVNFARHINIPGFYSFGFNDIVCPPTSMYSAYNVINAPKELMLVQETGHYSFPEQWDAYTKWALNFLKK